MLQHKALRDKVIEAATNATSLVAFLALLHLQTDVDCIVAAVAYAYSRNRTPAQTKELFLQLRQAGKRIPIDPETEVKLCATGTDGRLIFHDDGRYTRGWYPTTEGLNYLALLLRDT